MEECLQVIFTNEKGGQHIVEYPLENIQKELKSRQKIEDFLLLEYSTNLAKRGKDGVIKAEEWLVKISTCIYTENVEKYRYLYIDGWNGKFYYDPKILN